MTLGRNHIPHTPTVYLPTSLPSHLPIHLCVCVCVQDLVAWVTLGMHHIPHTEDIPNTPTVGTEAAILLLPYNYFPEDPSMRSRDAVRAQRSSSDPGAKATFQTYGTQTDFTCRPPVYGWLSWSTSTAYP